MRVYVSAPRSMRVEAESMAKIIEDAIPGAVVSPRWWETIPEARTDAGVPTVEARRIAQEQAIAVLSSDVLVFMSSSRGDGQGTHTELGLALAGQHLQGSPVVLGVGRHEADSIFHRLVTRWCGSWAEAVGAVREAGET